MMQRAKVGARPAGEHPASRTIRRNRLDVDQTATREAR